MATTNFKLFDENKANLLSDTEYANATQRLNGVQTGVASSQLNNKFAYQTSLVAYAIAQLMNANGLDANDTASVSAFVGNLQGALLQKVADMASTTEAAAGVLTNKYISPATMKAAALLLSGGVMNGVLNMNGNRITNLPTPTANSDPATKEYVDGINNSLTSKINSEVSGVESKIGTKIITVNNGSYTVNNSTTPSLNSFDLSNKNILGLLFQITIINNFTGKGNSSNSPSLALKFYNDKYSGDSVYLLYFDIGSSGTTVRSLTCDGVNQCIFLPLYSFGFFYRSIPGYVADTTWSGLFDLSQYKLNKTMVSGSETGSPTVEFNVDVKVLMLG